MEYGLPGSVLRSRVIDENPILSQSGYVYMKHVISYFIVLIPFKPGGNLVINGRKVNELFILFMIDVFLYH